MDKLYKTFPYAYWLFRKIVEKIDIYFRSNLLKFKKLTEFLDQIYSNFRKKFRQFKNF